MYLNTTVVGRLCSDPEVKTSKSGTSFANLNLACNLGSGDKKETIFVNAMVFGKSADFAGKYLKKGAIVLVEGTPKASAYLSKKTGEAVGSLEIMANNLKALSFGPRSEEQSQEYKTDSDNNVPF